MALYEWFGSQMASAFIEHFKLPFNKHLMRLYRPMQKELGQQQVLVVLPIPKLVQPKLAGPKLALELLLLAMELVVRPQPSPYLPFS